jgi:hypothetical protein
MTIEVRMGLLRDRVIHGGNEFEVRRGRDGWRHIVDPHGIGGRVRYDGWRDILAIESTRGSLQIRFRWRHTAFSWQGQTYRIGVSVSGHTIFRGDRPVAKARHRWSGVRFEFDDPELEPVARELALGLGHRATAMAIAVSA